MPTTYIIQCPAIIDNDFLMHCWYIEIHFEDNDIDCYTNYGTVYEMLEWCHWQMENKLDVARLCIWCDRKWWGEMERY